jgi:predicted nucleotidyltransferase
MNAPVIHRSILQRHVATIEAKHPIKLLGLLPRGSAAHVSDENALDFLGEKQPGLDLLGLCGAEVELGTLLGRPVGIVLVSGLKGREAIELPRTLDPL